MLQRLLALTALSAAVATTSAMKVHVRIHHSHHARAADTPSPAPTEDSSSESAAASTSGSGSESESAAGEADSDVWSFSPVRSIQARVQGNAPTWDTKTKTWVASFGKTYDEQFRSVLDTVNTASVEGALMYVQAEGINVKEQSVKCQRKNKMQYIVFYDISVVQPNASIAFYGEKHSTPEYCPFVAMDGGKCTPAGDDIPDTCKQFDGIGGQPKLGHCVGANEQVSDKRAPYPGNYWFSYPNSCVTQGWSNKTDECRAQYPGGLCPVGVKPDGVTCSFQYSILGYLNIDDLVGITDGSGTPDNKAYVNYTAFCNAGGVEFSADNNGQGFENVKSIPFWANPGDETANEARTTSMIELYNKIAPDAEIGTMLPLPDIDDLTGKNPSCYENNPTCATTPHGCRRILYSQVCEICEEQADDCVKAPSGYKFPSLEVPKAEKNGSSSGSSGSSSGNGSTIGTPSPSTSASSLAVVSSAAVAIGAVVATLL